MKWIKSTFSAGNGACVEVAHTRDGYMVRDSKDPDGAWLLFTREEWQAFVAGVLNREFN